MVQIPPASHGTYSYEHRQHYGSNYVSGGSNLRQSISEYESRSYLSTYVQPNTTTYSTSYQPTTTRYVTSHQQPLSTSIQPSIKLNYSNTPAQNSHSPSLLRESERPQV